MTGDDELQIAVCDGGRGFDPSALEKGFGLLSIRERLIALGGSLEIESEPGAGARFVMDFPVNDLPSAAAESDTQAHDASAAGALVEDRTTPGNISPDYRIRVLLVDDHQIVREGLVAMLQRQTKFEVVGEAGDGAEAIELVEQLRPDVVLMDVHLPRMDGIEATRRIKARHPQIQVIGLSWHEEVDQSQAMRNAGAAAYLGKEAASRALIKTLHNLYPDGDTDDAEPADG
jgi:CheY-like chemotaxis protein